MVFVIVLAVLTAVATYGALRPDELWFQHYSGKVARARTAHPGDGQWEHRRLVYLVTAVVCGVLTLLSLWAVWHGATAPDPRQT
ncbi:hypothetical protein [Arsenicicoccus dermatophilus]|uniref:hypothetical protein n=1 Tax=Arsenicicoccus dermatophilus TaxID=1076331 RepID=UPI0039174B7F